MKTILWTAAAALLLTATPVWAGEDLASALGDWPAYGDPQSGEMEPMVTKPVDGAGPATGSAPKSPWHFQLTFYLWATGLDATSTIDGVGTDIELDFSDIFSELLDGAFSARFEAWRGDFGILVNFDWISLDKELDITGPGPIGKRLDFDVKVEQYDFFVGAAWRFSGESVGAAPITVGFFGDLYGGFRYTSLKQTVDVKGDLLRKNLGGKESWIEPVVGLRLGYHLGSVVSLMVRGDAGGFGWSDWPDRDVIVLAGAEFRLAKWFGLRLGYQWRWLDYSTGSGRDEFGLKADYGGPWLGVTFQF